MAFRKGQWATVWGEGNRKSPGVCNRRITITKKNKTTGEWETEFTGYVSFLGQETADKAERLQERDRIVLGDAECGTYKNSAGKIGYTFRVFNFCTEAEYKTAARRGGRSNNRKPHGYMDDFPEAFNNNKQVQPQQSQTPQEQNVLDDAFIADLDISADDLPF